ncbi:MAG: ankyrin repeat domain-containing protein [Coxiellaceae bacterium]|nr:ankyrin repeat domain-containing protein [Coxiellaceae bacterium]
MSRPGAWSDRRSLSLPNLLECFGSSVEFISLLQGDQLLLLTDTTEELCPTDPDPRADYPSGWMMPATQRASDFNARHGTQVHAKSVRFTMTEVSDLIDRVLVEPKALFFLNALYADLKFHSQQQDNYIALVRRQVAQVIGRDVDKWIALQDHILTLHPEAVVVVLALLPEMQSTLPAEHYTELVRQTFESGDVMRQLLGLWPRVSPLLDAGGCFQAMRYYYASGNAALPTEMLTLASSLWNDVSHIEYLSTILFEACEHGDAAAIEMILRLPFKHLVAAINLRQCSSDPVDKSPGDLLLHKMIVAQSAAGPTFDDELIRQVLILTDNASLRCAEKYSADTFQASPLMLACANNRTNLMSMLLMRPEVLAHLNDQDDRGNTALHYVALGSSVLAQSLLFNAHMERGNALKLHLPNRYGETALHLLCKGGDAEMLKFMLFNFSAAATGAAKRVKDKSGNLPIAYLPAGAASRTLLETSDLARYRIDAAMRRSEAPSSTAEAAPYLSAPKGEKRKEIYQAVKMLFSQWQGGDGVIDWLWWSRRTRWTHDSPEVRRLIYAACEDIYQATSKWEIEAIIGSLHDQTLLMDDGVERSVIRSDTVKDLQLRVGVSHNIPVSGLAWVLQIFWWPLRADSAPDAVSPFAIVAVPAARRQFAMRVLMQMPVAHAVAVPPLMGDDGDLNPKEMAFGDDAAILAWNAPTAPASAAVPPPSRAVVGYPRLMSAVPTAPAFDRLPQDPSVLLPPPPTAPTAPTMDPADTLANDHASLQGHTSPQLQDNDLDPVVLKQ